MSVAGGLSALLASFDTTAPGLTLFRVAQGLRLIGPPVDGVAAMLVLSGTMRLEIEGEAAMLVKAGHLALVPAGRAARLGPAGDHAKATLDGRECLMRRDGWLVADATHGREAALVVGAGRIAGSGPETLPGAIVSALTQCRVGKPIFALLRAECALASDGQPALANALMNACVVQGLRRAIAGAPATPAADAVRPGPVSSAVARVRARPGERHTIATLAAAAGMSRSSFLRHFKRIMHIGPAEYVKRVRLDEARTMLDATDLPIKTIAARSGFPSRSHFSRAFRASFGRDPTSYRDKSDA